MYSFYKMYLPTIIYRKYIIRSLAVKLQYRKLNGSSVAKLYICRNVCLSIKAHTSSKHVIKSL